LNGLILDLPSSCDILAAVDDLCPVVPLALSGSDPILDSPFETLALLSGTLRDSRLDFLNLAWE
jgi:hypothetical protein